MTQVLSVRRTPVALAADATRHEFDALLSNLVGQIDGDGVSCFAAALDGTPVAAAGAGRAVVPASNLKLVTAAVALDVLKPDSTFTTSMLGNLAGDTVNGDLFFVGGGDATLSDTGYPSADPKHSYQIPVQPFTKLDDLADKIVAAGVRHVTGRLVGDESRYDTERYNPKWAADIVGVEAGPLSALLVDDGKVAFTDRLPADGPPLAAARHLSDLLEARGVTISGGVATGTAPPGTPLVTDIQSPALSDVVKEMLTTSDDNTAELMVKELGFKVKGVGSTEQGLEVVRETLTSWGVPMDGVELFDGSGLSDVNHVTCELIMAVLGRSGVGEPLYEGLAIAGQTGTLAAQFGGTPVVGVLRAKTGTLHNARSLSGYVPSGDRLLRFSLVINGEGAEKKAEPLWTELAHDLATIPAAVDPATLAPGA